MTSRPPATSLGWWFLCLALLAAAGCARGGGSGGGGPVATGKDFELVSLHYGRLQSEAGEERVISPLTRIRRDGLGAFVPGSLERLRPEVSLDELPTLGLSPGYQPVVVPRDAVLVAQFSEPLRAASVMDPVLGPGDVVTRPGSVVLEADGALLPCRLTLAGPRTLWIHADAGWQEALPASPLAFGDRGEAVGVAGGFVRIHFPDHGEQALENRDGETLQRRRDGLGSAGRPIGLHPGNHRLDFIRAGGLLNDWEELYGGYLPEDSGLRLMRTHRTSGRASAGGANFVEDTSQVFDRAARQGMGEWAGARLVLRPDTATEEVRTVAFHSVSRVTVEPAFALPAAAGDGYSLERPELFEPDPLDPIDPVAFDPFNPQNAANQQLASFVEVVEVDARGDAVGPAYSLQDSGVVPPFSELRLRFNLPLDAASVMDWETVHVEADPAAPPGAERLFGTRLSPDGQSLSMVPGFRDAAGRWRLVGWDVARQSLQLRLLSIPRRSFLTTTLTPPARAEFLAAGPVGLRSRRGAPLQFPRSHFDAADPRIQFRVPFVTDPAASQAASPPVPEDWGVLVLRFEGQSISGVDPVSGEATLRFRDGDYHLKPPLEVNAAVTGSLTGHPVAFVERVYDDAHPTADDPGMLESSPGTVLPLFSVYGALRSNLVHAGVRLQHIYRDVDCSPGGSLFGTQLDLCRISWCVDDQVYSDVYEDVSIRVGHSSHRPFLYDAAGNIPDAFIGLEQTFDFDTWLNTWRGAGPRCSLTTSINQGPNTYQGSFQTVVQNTPYVVAREKAVVRGAHLYHPWPEFDAPFAFWNGAIAPEHRAQIKQWNATLQAELGVSPWKDRRRIVGAYDNRGGDSLVIEYRIQPQETVMTARNAIRYSPAFRDGLQFPLYRVYSVGGDTNNDGRLSPGERLFPDQVNNDYRARCATGKYRGPVPGQTTYGANERYFMSFQYVKIAARIDTTYLPVNASTACFSPPLLVPPPGQNSPGTRVAVLVSGATDALGTGATAYSEDPGLAKGRSHLSLRFELMGSAATRQVPFLDRVAVPFQRQ